MCIIYDTCKMHLNHDVGATKTGYFKIVKINTNYNLHREQMWNESMRKEKYFQNDFALYGIHADCEYW